MGIKTQNSSLIVLDLQVRDGIDSTQALLAAHVRLNLECSF